MARAVVGTMMRLAALIMAVLMVAACGRRGAPELPPEAQTLPRAPIYAPEPEGPTAPDRPFVGDRILQ